MIESVTGAGAAVQPKLQLVTPAQPVQTPSDPSGGGSRGGGDDASAGGRSAPATTAPATRIFVDRADSGVYVYRLVDVASGRVLAELPRDQSDKLKLGADYTPGAVADASA